MNYNGNITAPEKTSPVSDLTFDSLLDETCELLLDRQVKYAIQRIYDMEKRLGSLERELDEFLSIKKRRK
jgi:UTP:GlnB (protein PII) uridylyltransferase